MKRFMKRFTAVAIAITVCLSFAGCSNQAKTEKADFSYWNEGAKSLSALKDYVTSVTGDEKSADFIPPKDRIAIFDMDGTFVSETAPSYMGFMLYLHRVLEDSSYKASEEKKAMANKILDGINTGVFSETLEEEHAALDAISFAGMTLDEYDKYVKDFIKTPVKGFKNMTYATSWYKPMLQVIDYLNNNGFKVYVCSGADRFMCRAAMDGVVNVSPEQIIGMDVLLGASGQGETNGFNYVYTDTDKVVRTNKHTFKTVKANKVSEIAREIGRQPVLAFGNSNGDISMAIYTTRNNKYKSAAFMVLADDDVREYGNPEKAAKLKEKWEGYGWNTISMKNDFATIYGDDVIKDPTVK